MVAVTEEDLKHNIAALEEAVREHNTNTMVVSREPMEWNIKVEEHSVESAEEVVYLGVMFMAIQKEG